MEMRTNFVSISRKSNNRVLQLIADPTLFTSSDIVLSRVLPLTKANRQHTGRRFCLVDRDRISWGSIDHTRIQGVVPTQVGVHGMMMLCEYVLTASSNITLRVC